MEGNGSGFPYFYHHRLLHLGPGQGEPGAAFSDGGEPSGIFPSSSSSSAAGEGGGNPALFPQSAVAAAAGGRASAPARAVDPARRKRGRPRKYGPAAPSSSPPPAASTSPAAPSFSVPSSAYSVNKVPSSASPPLTSSPPPQMPPGRKKAQHASVGKGGQSFTPYFLTAATGEDVVQKIMTFVQQQRRVVCIISASGPISSATLRQPAMSGGHVTYEGNFDIVSLSGSFLLTETGGAYSRTGALSVCLSDERCVIGGGVSGPLVAAGPVQVFAGSFLVGSDKNLSAAANVEKDTVSNLSTLFPEPDASPSAVVWSTGDATGMISTTNVTDDHHQSTGGRGNSFVLQPRGVHAVSSRSSTDLGVRLESGHLGAAYRSPEGRNE